MHQTGKTSTISFRVENHLKKRLEDTALRERRSLSSVIVGILEDALDSQEGDSPHGKIQEEKRHQPRKQILLPARWRTKQEDGLLEHDVLLKNISVGGAYTEYINGQSFHFVKNLQVSQLALVVRLPESQEPVVVDCKVSRLHITGSCMGVGLRFLTTLNDEGLLK